MPRYKDPEYLAEFLEQYTVPELKKLAGLISSFIPTRKAEVIGVIKTYLSNPENLRRLWQQLDAVQQAAVSEVVHSSSSHFEANRFRAKYGQDPDWGASDRYSYGRNQNPSRLNLFFYYRQTMPHDLKETLKTFVPPPRTVQIKSVDQLPETVAQTHYEYDYNTHKSTPYTAEISLTRLETERAALHDVHAVLRLIDTGKVRASDKTKRVSKAGGAAIINVLHGGDFYPDAETLDDYDQTPIVPIKAFAWPLILQSAGLVELAGTKLQLTPAGQKALTLPAHKVIQTVWKRWLKTNLLDEFNRVHPIKGQTGKGKRNMTAVAGRRQAVAQALAECPANQWLTFDEFSRFMQAAGHTFEVTREPWDLYIADPHYGSLGYDGFNDWHILQGRYMLAFLFEYAATMGLIDVAYIHPAGARADYGNLWGVDELSCFSRYDGLMYIRLNNLGDWCLDVTQTYAPSPIKEQQILRVLPNLDVVATGPLPPGDALFLEQITEQTSDSVWKLQREKLLKAAETGQKIADVEAFLNAKSGHDLPDTVITFLRETDDRLSGLTHRGEAWLIEAKDEALAQLIANDSTLRSLCMLAGERHLVVPRDNQTAFRRALRKLGYGVAL